MSLRLQDVSKTVGSETHVYPTHLALAGGRMHVLLGPTTAGKTTLLRLIAGLDRPSSGRIFANDIDVTGVAVRERRLAMVYQQFVNYASLTVFENIASPLRLARMNAREIQARVARIAERLRLSALLDRYPQQLSGGQQQRTALARALAKDTDLILLDEPLVNLDYKLREELRAELLDLLRERERTVVYASTEPYEALQLGGDVTLLDAGRVVQSGPMLDVFARPASLQAARLFSDPPLNIVHARMDSSSSRMHIGSAEVLLPQHMRPTLAEAKDVQVAWRAHQLGLQPTATSDVSLPGEVQLAEISGSETFVHVRGAGTTWVAQLRGVHTLALGEACTVHASLRDAFVFDADGRTLYAPVAHGTH